MAMVAIRRRPSGEAVLPGPVGAPALPDPDKDRHHMTEALIGLGLMMVLALLRIPIAIAAEGPWALSASSTCATGTLLRLAMVGPGLRTGRSYALRGAAFFLMGNPGDERGGMCGAVRAAYTFISHLRGGLAMATVCAAPFGAIRLLDRPPPP
jgi:hypothetical protein